MRKAVMMLAIMALAGCGSDIEWFPSVDTKPPTVTSFSYYAEQDSLTVQIDTLTASDDEGVTGYLITETATPPTAAGGGWLSAPPATYVLSSASVKTLYAWAMDAVGNVSAGRSAGPAYTLQTSVPFPDRVRSVSDIAHDASDNSYWLLASLTSGTIPNALVKINASGQTMQTVFLAYSPASFIGEESSLAYDGTTFWVSSSGYDNSVNPAVPKSEIYRIASSGQYLGFYPCPATSTGFCQGVAWDGTTLWASGSDNRNLVNFSRQVVGGALPVVRSYDNIWGSNGVSDAGYDRATGRLLVLKDGLITVNGADGVLLGSSGFTLPGNGKGDWDGTYFWLVDKVNSRLLRIAF